MIQFLAVLNIHQLVFSCVGTGKLKFVHGVYVCRMIDYE